MNIRTARPADAAAIAAIWNVIIRDTLITFTTKERTEATLAAHISERQGAFWVAEEAGKVLGFVTYGPFRTGPGYATTAEHTLILAPEGRGRGLGRALMHKAMEHAAAHGIHVMVAGISAANPGAVAFHAALGFEQTGKLPQVGRKSGQWLDLIFMQKTLPSS
ncbi:N-acetyltransferase family protein [Marimonas sp. MJW-29]|uniref:N-acetyltransferase family protein n=1 Tax=Sulfitobacter sediminis TaxID=3234186 RepID=A0ABV3RR24_9RHOB